MDTASILKYFDRTDIPPNVCVICLLHQKMKVKETSVLLSLSHFLDFFGGRRRNKKSMNNYSMHLRNV